MKDTKKEDDNKQWRTVIHKFFAGTRERENEEKSKRNEGDWCVYVFVFYWARENEQEQKKFTHMTHTQEIERMMDVNLSCPLIHWFAWSNRLSHRWTVHRRYLEERERERWSSLHRLTELTIGVKGREKIDKLFSIAKKNIGNRFRLRGIGNKDLDKDKAYQSVFKRSPSSLLSEEEQQRSRNVQKTLKTWNASNWMFLLFSFNRFICCFKLSVLLMNLVITEKLYRSSSSSPSNWKRRRRNANEQKGSKNEIRGRRFFGILWRYRKFPACKYRRQRQAWCLLLCLISYSKQRLPMAEEHR